MSATGAAVQETTLTEEERARADAIMKGWFALNDYTQAMEAEFGPKTAEIGRAVADLVAERIGTTDNLIEDRDAEFGRIIGNIIRTFQMKLPYHHQGNDALIKEQLKWVDFAFSTGKVEEMIEWDIESMREILSERVYWIEQTGDIHSRWTLSRHRPASATWSLAEGFEFHDNRHRVSYVSPYKRILEKGWKRESGRT